MLRPRTIRQYGMLRACSILKRDVEKISGTHEYHRFVYDGVDLDRFNCLYLEMYYSDNEKAFTSIIIYHADVAKHSSESVKITPEDCGAPQK